jgi:uncharacterized protein DUF3168
VTVVSESPLNALQKAIFTRLSTDATLTALLGAAGRVVDQVTEGTPYPYVRIGDHLSTPDNDHGTFGREVTVTLHVWTKTRGNSSGQAIASRIGELLDHQTAAMSALLDADGHRCVSIRNEFDQALTDPDPEIRHHVIRVRVQTVQLS